MCHHYIVNWIYEVINFRFNYLEMSALVSSSTAAHVTVLIDCGISFLNNFGTKLEIQPI